MTSSFLRSVAEFYQDNTAAKTVEIISQFGWEQLSHPPESSELGPLKNSCRKKMFSSDEEVKDTTNKWLEIQSKDFYAEGIQKFKSLMGKMCFKE